MERFIIEFLLAAAEEAEFHVGFTYVKSNPVCVEQLDTLTSFTGWAKKWIERDDYVKKVRPLLEHAQKLQGGRHSN